MLTPLLFSYVFFAHLIIVFPLNNRLCSTEESAVIRGKDEGDNFIADDGTVYKMGEFWRDNITKNTFGCVCLHKPCLIKCCPQHQVVTSYDRKEFTCGEVEDKKWSLDDLDIYVSDDAINGDTLKMVSKTDSKNKMGAHVRNPCKHGMFSTKDFHILDNGQIYEEFQNSDYSIDHLVHEDSYCVDYMNVTVVNENGTLESSEFVIQAQICIDKDGDGDSMRDVYVLYAIFMVINSVFLIMTLVTYCSLLKLRNTMGKSLICFVVCLLIGYIALFYDRVTEFKKPLQCKTTAYAIYFFLMAGYFWLNVMCYDIYSAFKAMQSVNKSNSKKKFIIYSCYAWGSPMAMFVFAYTVDMYGPNFILKPQMAVTSCWFGQSKPLYIYFYGPMMILLAANSYFFIVTIYKLHQVSKQTEVLKNAESQRHHQKEKDRCYLYGKLFIVMGVTWIMEVVSDLVGGKEFFWYPTDIINICQGISIFIIFVLKRRVLYMLNQKFCPSIELIKASETISSKPTSSTGSSGQNGNILNGAVLNGNACTAEAPNNLYVQEGYDNPIPMTPVTSRVEPNDVTLPNNGDVAVPIDDTANRRY